jgi:hypothetical protein
MNAAKAELLTAFEGTDNGNVTSFCRVEIKVKKIKSVLAWKIIGTNSWKNSKSPIQMCNSLLRNDVCLCSIAALTRHMQMTRKPTDLQAERWFFFLRRWQGSVAAKSGQTKDAPLSSTESETIRGSHATMQGAFIKRFFEELKISSKHHSNYTRPANP